MKIFFVYFICVFLPPEILKDFICFMLLFLVAQTVKNLPTVEETWVRSLGWKILWRRPWQPTPVFLPGESPWTEESGELQSMGLQRVGPDRVTKCSMDFFRSCTGNINLGVLTSLIAYSKYLNTGKCQSTLLGSVQLYNVWISK